MITIEELKKMAVDVGDRHFEKPSSWGMANLLLAIILYLEQLEKRDGVI